MSTEQLVTFMCDGVAARLDQPGFLMGLKTLVGELGLSTQQLVTFMCGGVAARLGQPGF